MIHRPRTLLAAAFAAVGVVLLDHRSMLGAMLVLVFVTVAPGAALARLARFPTTGAAAWSVAIAASFALDAVVTEALLYARVWTPARGLFALAALTIALVAAERLASKSRIPRPLGSANGERAR